MFSHKKTKIMHCKEHQAKTAPSPNKTTIKTSQYEFMLLYYIAVSHTLPKDPMFIRLNKGLDWKWEGTGGGQ